MEISKTCIGGCFLSHATFVACTKYQLIEYLRTAEDNYQFLKKKYYESIGETFEPDELRRYTVSRTSNSNDIDCENQKKKIQKLGKLCVQNGISEVEIFQMIQKTRSLEDKGWTD